MQPNHKAVSKSRKANFKSRIEILIFGQLWNLETLFNLITVLPLSLFVSIPMKKKQPPEVLQCMYKLAQEIPIIKTKLAIKFSPSVEKHLATFALQETDIHKFFHRKDANVEYHCALNATNM